MSTSGLILIDKPAGLTSYDIVRNVKKSLHMSCVGHLGTLDPFASGLLPILVGSTTRLADELMSSEKQYLFTVALGNETDTLDPMGSIIQSESVPQLSEEKILAVIQKFTGAIVQIPPLYSALKMNGRPLYEHMRTTGKIPYDIETKKREIQIKNFELVSFDAVHGTITLRVVCSKGTYIRSLARDISYALGTVGMCSALRREKIGTWNVEDAVEFPITVDDGKTKIILRQNDDGICKNNLIAPTKLLPNYPHFLFPEIYFTKLNAGNVFLLDKHVHNTLFESILNYLHTNSSEKIFASIENRSDVLFFSFAEKNAGDKILIRPKKRL